MIRKQATFTNRSLFLIGTLLVLFFADLLLGSVSISLQDFFNSLFGNSSNPLIYDIVLKFRLPKAITCLLAGSSLALAGLLMQTLFRNPLAGPDVLGLSSGASLMVALLVMASQTQFDFFSFLGQNPWSLAMAASSGSILIFLLMISVAQYLKDNSALLIVGLMVSAATASIVSVLQFLSKAEDLQSFTIWSLGSVGNTTWKEIEILFIITLLGTGLSIWLIKPLNAWLLGENYAKSLGINLKQSRLLIVASTGLLAGGITAFCGPIAFVGLAVPHLVKLLIPTTNHKLLIPVVMAGGSILLLLCDIITQLPTGAQVLPLNAVTSMIGAPVVIWMVIRYKQISV